MNKVPPVLEKDQNTLDYLNKTKIPLESAKNDQNAPVNIENIQNTLDT